MFMDPDLTADRMDRHTLGVAVTVGESRRQRVRPTGKRIVFGNRTIGIQSQDGAIVVSQVLRFVILATIPNTDKELAVGPESYARPEMPPTRRGARCLEDHGFVTQRITVKPRA
jgi:hypothetical protein